MHDAGGAKRPPHLLIQNAWSPNSRQKKQKKKKNPPPAMPSRWLLLLLLGGFVCAGVDGAGPRPNLLFLMADQMRFDAFAAGARRPGRAAPSWTPALDRLAAEGARFAAAYSSTPTCTPARAALLTGQSPWQHGMLGYGQVAHRYPFEMPRALAAAGYTTHTFGKDHFWWAGRNNASVARNSNNSNTTHSNNNNTFRPYAHGYMTHDLYEGIVTEPDDYRTWFERLHPGETPESAGWPTLDMNSWRGAPFALANESDHPTKYVGDRAVAFLESVDNSTTAAAAAAAAAPWFTKISFHRPHSPYDPPARILDAIREADLPPVVVSDPGAPGRWDAAFATDAACGPARLDAWCGDMPHADRELARRAYRGSIAFVDEQIGRIMATLERRGLLERTLVLFTADHGDGQGDHYHWRKGYPYEFSAHVPMIVRWPAASAAAAAAAATTTPPPAARGTVVPASSGVVALRDVFPTFLDAAGALGSVPPNHTLQGASVLCLLGRSSSSSSSSASGGGGGCPAAWRPWLDLEHTTCYNETNHWNALTDGATKYVFNAFSATEQLFDLVQDPYEKVDLAGDAGHAATLARWRGRLVAQFEREGRGPVWVANGTLQRRTKPQTYSPNYPRESRRLLQDAGAARRQHPQ